MFLQVDSEDNADDDDLDASDDDGHDYSFLQVDCNDNSAVFAHCFPSQLLPLFLDGLPFCEFLPIHSTSSNRL